MSEVEAGPVSGTPLRASVVWIAAGVIFLCALLWQFLSFNGFPNDHYFHVALARQMLSGDRPVRDFVDAGAPLTYVISALARWRFGDVAMSELVVVAIGVAVGAAAAAISASWLAQSVVVGGGVALLNILISPRSYSYPKVLLYGLAGCAIVAVAQRGSRTRLLMAAALIAVSFLMRHDHGLYIGVACALALALSAASLGEMARRAAIVGAAIVVLLAPWAAWVQYYQGLIPYFKTGVAVSRREADISLLRDWPRLHPLAGLDAANSEAWLFYLFYLLPIACLAAAIWRRVTRRESWPGESAAVAALSVLAFVADGGFLRNPLATRLPDASVPACLLGAWLIGRALWGQTQLVLKPDITMARSVRLRAGLPRFALRAAAVAVIVVTSLSVWVEGDVHDKLDEAGAFDDWAHVSEHARVLWRVVHREEKDVRKFPSRVSASLVPFFWYLERCSARTDRILVSGSYPDVFVLARRGFAAGHIAFRQGFYASDADQALMLSRMKRESVPFVLLVLDEQTGFESSFPTLMSYITSAYDEMVVVPVEGMKGVRVMVERSRHRDDVDPSTGWPCFHRDSGGSSS